MAEAGHGVPAALSTRLLLLILTAVATPPACAAPTAATPGPGPEMLQPEAYLNAADLPLLMPTNRSTDGRGWYFELPRRPVGLLVMLHRCGRNAEDFWPPSRVCPQCIGLPEGVSISKQALARGYALMAINSADRDVGPGTRCWSWGTDATAVRDIVKAFRKEMDLTRLPLFFTGCSSGGSLALRLPSLMQIDGIMPVAIGLSEQAFPLADPENLKHPYPPVAFVHFAKDSNTAGKVAGMRRVMAERGVPSAEGKVEESPMSPDFFARRDPMISLEVSEQLHTAFVGAGFLDPSTYFIADPWRAEGQSPPWDPILYEQLGRWLEAAQAEQLALKNGTTLAQAQRALDAQGEQPLRIQEVSFDRVAAMAAATEAEVNAKDVNPNFSDSDGTSSSSAGKDPFLSDKLLDQHIKEQIAVAWASHTNYGDHTTAALVWLERCGQADFRNLVARHMPASPAALSPVLTAAPARVIATWRECQLVATAAPDSPPAASDAAPGPVAGSADPGPAQMRSTAYATSSAGPTILGGRAAVRALAIAASAAAAAALVVLL